MDNQHYKSYEQAALDILRGKKPEDKVAEQKQTDQPQEKKQLEEASYSAKDARAGKDIGKPGKMFSKIAASAAERYGSKEAGARVAGAILKKQRMKEDEEFSDEQIEALLDEEEQFDEAAMHPMALHVKRVPGQMKNGQEVYKVHAVGAKVTGIKTGEHLNDTELDDATEAGHKIKMMKEDAEQIEELSPSTLKSYKDKANKEIKALDKEVKTGEYKDIAGKIMDRRMKGTDMAANKLDTRSSNAKLAQRGTFPYGEEVEQVDFTVIEHSAFVIDLPESLSYSDYLNAAKTIVQEEQDVVTVADYFFNLKDESLIIESFTRSDIESKVDAHAKAGHQVSMPKYSTKEGKPYAEYTVTNKETGQKTRYIHHGTTRKTERLG